MGDSGNRRSVSRRKNLGFRRSLCCSFVAPKSPKNIAPKNPKHDTTVISKHYNNSIAGSFANSPSPNPRSGLGFIDPRRILSPGRVSPIDSEPSSLDQLSENCRDVVVVQEPELEPKLKVMMPERLIRCSASTSSVVVKMEMSRKGSLDARLDLKGKGGGRLVLELESEVLRKNSSFFSAKMSSECWKSEGCVVEITEVGDLDVFRETIELMYEKDIVRKLMKIGVTRSIAILEISTTIKFDRGITACLNYLEAVPWTESEEDKLKTLFTKFSFDGPNAQDILARLYPEEPTTSQHLAIHLIQSVTGGTNPSATRELKSLVKGLLSQSSVYKKDTDGLTKDTLYSICGSCLSSLVHYFEEASDSVRKGPTAINDAEGPLIGRISKQVENLNWLLEILVDKQMGEDFVGLWANQKDLLRMHEQSSPMVRYELSRISSHIFIAMGKGKLQCRWEERYGVLRTWFGPMLTDFGWLQRCSKGLDVRELEAAMGQALLTLPLKQQQGLFLEWFGCFSKHGSECPNLTRAFQVWWRRSFLGAMEPNRSCDDTH